MPPPGSGWFLSGFAGSRVFVVLPDLGSFLSAIALYVYGTLVVVRIILDTFSRGDVSVNGAKLLQVAFIPLTDVFLLGTVLVIVAFGLYQLFLQPGLPVPPWLKIESLGQLASKLIGVVGLLIGVTFLAFVVEVQSGASDLEFGISTAAVIAPLSLLLIVSHRLGRDAG
jgi:uncharacterized membrane protein YqhA